MRLRTRAIRCDRPTVQGSPARSPAQCPRAGCQLVLPHRTIRCDAKDHARPRKYLEQNTFSKRGVQVEPEGGQQAVCDRTRLGPAAEGLILTHSQVGTAVEAAVQK